MNQNINQEKTKLNQPERDSNSSNRTGPPRRVPSNERRHRNNHRRKPIKSQWNKQRRRKKRLQRWKRNAIPLLLMFLMTVGVVYLVVFGIRSFFQNKEERKSDTVKAQVVELDGEIEKMTIDSPDIDVRLLTVNEYSRPGTKVDGVKGIVIHYVGNPGTTAEQNRNYFESLKETHDTSASSHFVVGLDGEIIQCVPTIEVAYCSNQRNNDTVSIECCHKKKDGKFTEETYDSLVHLTAFLCCKYDLDIEDIIRHYDVTGKECPKYYVDHEEKWIQFKKDVATYIERNAHLSK